MPRTKPKPTPPSDAAAQPNHTAVLGQVLTLSEAAAYLRLTEQDVLRMVREQNLHARQIGCEWRFLKAAIQDWLRTGTPLPLSSKEALLALAGKFKDDPDLEAIVKEASQRRAQPVGKAD